MEVVRIEIFSEAGEGILLGEDERRIIEKLESGGYAIEIKLLETGVRIVSVRRGGQLGQGDDSGQRGDRPTGKPASEDEMELALKAGDVQMLRRAIRNYCGERGIPIRGVCFEENEDGAEDGILYVGAAGWERGREEMMARIKEEIERQAN